MRSISLPFPVRTLAAALIVAAFASCAHAATAGVSANGASAPAPAPAPAPSGNHGQVLPGADADACGGALALAAPSPFGDGGDAVKALSRATERYIKQCGCATQQCIADALDQYAEALAVVAPRLPPELQDMPDIVAQAAHRVRIARTNAAAVKALHEAIAVIHKDISLVRAEDPAMQQRETRSGGFVVETLNVASLSLEKAGGL